MLAHDDMRVNRLLYLFIEKELSRLFSLQRIEDLFSYRREGEQAFGKYVNSSNTFCSLVDSGTTGLYLACALIGIKAGDEVILPILSWPSTVAAVLARGAVPKFIDIKIDCTLNEQLITTVTSKKTKCIIPVHMYGHAANMESLVVFAKDRQLEIIEDCCQAHGTRIHGKMVGTLGEYGVFSFDPFKTIATVGTGGAIVYRKKEYRDDIHAMLSIETANPLVLELHRTPGKMSFTDVAVLKVKLKVATLIEKKKKLCVARYEEGLRGTPITFIADQEGVVSIRQSYLVYAPERDGLLTYLAKEGIICKEPYAPLHRVPLYAQYVGNHLFPMADYYTKKAIILPLFSMMEPKEVDIVCGKIRDFYCNSSS